jgi:hypothetical protein
VLTGTSYGLVEFLEREFSTTRLFVIKDPRMCRFVPLWLDATREFGAEPKAIIPVRNPIEVAASLLRRDGLRAYVLFTAI